MIEKLFTRAHDVRGAYPTPLNEEAAWKFGHAAGQFLKRSRQSLPASQKVKREDTLVVGRDVRPSSPALAGSLIEGLRSTGMNVVDVGVVDTPLVYFAINALEAVGGIQVTASHEPAHHNGFKLSGPRAKPIGAAGGLDDVRRIASLLRVGQTGLRGRLEEADLWPQYRRHVLQFLHLKRPIKVAVDAANGAAGRMVPALFGGTPDLGIVPLFFETPGEFVHEPDPSVEANLRALREKVVEAGCDLGVCFDGDADRCVFVDETGRTVASDLVTALLARDFLLQPQNAGATVVYDLRSSHAVADEVKAYGGVPRRERVGHAFLMRTMAETNAIFGGELSGRFYFRDNFYADSGAIAVARVLSVLSEQIKPFSQVVAPMCRYRRGGQLAFHAEDKDSKIREVADHFKKGKIDYLDGATIDLGSWWFNIRKSDAGPVLYLTLEADSAELLAEKLDELKKILGEPAAEGG